jgi:DNA-binding transcriptional ArsR family regulator
LSQPTRLAVFRALVQAGPDGLSAGALAALVHAPSSTLSAHLKILEQADLVTSRRLSRHIFYAARYDTARALIAFLMENCCAGHPAICGPEAATCV